MVTEATVEIINTASRLKGVSGLMRVKNDSEFLELSIESALPALDELVIVYNDCNSLTIDILAKIEKKHSDKVSVFCYNHKIQAFDLNPDIYFEVLNLPSDSPSLLSSYYNFGLSKTNYQYVLKIDTDQIYFTEKLVDLCNLYRNRKFNIVSLIYILVLFILKIYLSISHNHIIRTLFSIFNPKIVKIYMLSLKKVVSSFGVATSLSGINAFYADDLFVQKQISPSLFNGVGDHLIFKVNKYTYFDRYVCPDYNQMINDKYAVIEQLKGVRYYFPIGFYWIHLNKNRTKQYKSYLVYFNSHRSSFILLSKFLKDDIIGSFSNRIFNYSRLLFNNDRVNLPISFLRSIYQDIDGFFKI